MFGSGTGQVDRVDAEVPQTVVTGLRKHHFAGTAAGGGIQILVRMTHRHFAIFRTRVKPYRVYNSSGPVCR